MTDQKNARAKGAFLLGIITTTFVLVHELHLIYNVIFNGHIATAKVVSENFKYAGYGSDSVSRYIYYVRIKDNDLRLADLESRHNIGEQVKVVCFKDKSSACLIAPKDTLNDMAAHIAFPITPITLVLLAIAIFSYQSHRKSENH